MRVADLREIRGIPISGQDGLVWKPVRDALGIQAFGINAYTAASAGDRVVEEHDELGGGAGRHEELYVVLSGHALFSVDGRGIDAPAGTCVFLDDPAERRGAIAREPDTTVLAIGGTRGQAFRVSPWEFSFRAASLAEQGKSGEARALMQEGLAEYPDHPSLLYNLACFESLAGERRQALEHLASAVVRDPDLLGHAQTDPDFDPLRDDPGFPREVSK